MSENRVVLVAMGALINRLLLSISVSLSTLTVSVVQADDELIIIEDDAGEDYSPADDSIRVVESESEAEASLVIEDDEELLLFEGDATIDSDDVDDTRSSSMQSVSMYEEQSTTFKEESSPVSLSLEQVQVEASYFPKQHSADRYQLYTQAEVRFDWTLSQRWSVRLEAAVDDYRGWRRDDNQRGGDDWSHTELDYGESYIRYSGEHQTFTLGAQKILWGRIDEFPPTDRLSTQDLRRFVLDDLEHRRLASPAIRYQYFLDSSQWDFVVYPKFREAELPDSDSSWFPVNQSSGEVLGLETTALTEVLVRNTAIKNHAPDSDGGFGVRYSGLGDSVDYGLTLQKGRQSIPYFTYNPVSNVIESRYPRTDIVGADFGFEALGGTVKVEMAWLSDTPVTTRTGEYQTVESINWGVALEIFPGDSDARLNLQLTGNQFIDATRVLDRDQQVALNGSFETPFSDHNWRTKIRFNVGLDMKDVYLNPELAYIGWDGHETYFELHYFEGDKGTAGGFYEENSTAAIGWRANY